MAYRRPRQEPAEIYRGGGRVPLDANQFREGAFHSRPDPRFGGNISRANVGAQYPQGGVDVRYENYRAPHRVDYTRNIPRQTGTPNFRPPYGAPGQPSYGDWMQQIDPYAAGMYGGRRTGEEAWESEKAKREKMMEFMEGPLHPNPRMRGQGEGGTGLYKGSPFYSNPYYEGMGGGLGGLQEQAAVDPSDWRTILKILQAGGDPGTETKAASLGNGIGSTNEYQTAGLWQTWKKILERTGSEDLANQWLESQQAV